MQVGCKCLMLHFVRPFLQMNLYLCVNLKLDTFYSLCTLDEIFTGFSLTIFHFFIVPFSTFCSVRNFKDVEILAKSLNAKKAIDN